ncbi:MAG TPA: SH3 domain-containing protein [Novosphingobium sp.]|nr:SH3 domain-containing protein [Novosphingobium sp.]
MLAMTGPSVRADPGCLPVRGDLAHVKLAGLYFVPHYAAPMPRALRAGAVLNATGRDDGEAVMDLPAGAIFNVLDISGQWAWGQLGEDGPVGYVALGQLEAQA